MNVKRLKKDSGEKNPKFDINQVFPKLQRFGEKFKNLMTKDIGVFQKEFPSVPECHLCQAACLYYADWRPSPIQGHMFVSTAYFGFLSIEEDLKLVVPYTQIESISVSDCDHTKNTLQVYKTDDTILVFNTMFEQKFFFEFLCNVWRNNHNPDFENETVRVGCMCIPKRVECTEGVRDLNEESSSSSEGGRTKSGMSNNANSKTELVSHSKIVTIASAATTDTVSQASLPGTNDGHKEPAACDCGEHKGTVFLDKTYRLEVAELYQLLFTENESLLQFLKTAKRSDLHFESWTVIDHGERRKKKRTARYTVELSSTLGPKCTHVTEVQVVAEVGPNAVDGYTITKDAVNAGVPYADSFSVFCTYCLTRVGPNKARLKVHGEIVYRKSVMGVFKSIIERMTLSGMHDYYKHLDKYLSSYGRNEESRNGAGSDWISEFPESEVYTQLESDSIQSQDIPINDIRLHAELHKHGNEIKAQVVYFHEIQKTLRLVIILLVLIFTVCVWNTYRYSQLESSCPFPGPASKKNEL